MAQLPITSGGQASTSESTTSTSTTSQTSLARQLEHLALAKSTSLCSPTNPIPPRPRVLSSTQCSTIPTRNRGEPDDMDVSDADLGSVPPTPTRRR